MADENGEICGFLDAKLPGGKYMTQRVKKRSLAAWKVWRRQWCSVRKLGPGLGVEVKLDCGVGNSNTLRPNERNNCVKVPQDAILCRTESRSKQFAFGIFPAKERKPLLYLSGNSETETQRWMANIRQLLRPRKHRFMEGAYNISFVDNSHSRMAGLTGLYGDLVASRIGVFIKDYHSGEIMECLEWKSLSQFHLITVGRPEDVKRICVLHTTKDFRGGVGELHVFCLEASRLLQDLVTQGRGPKHKHMINQRPLSLSEGDLRFSVSGDEGLGNIPVMKNKIASSLINAGLGLFLPSRSGSEAKLLTDTKDNNMLNNVNNSKLAIHPRAVDNVYQLQPTSSSNIGSSLEELENPVPRRVSSVSIASGIYEEILDDEDTSKSIKFSANLYENPEDLAFSLRAKLRPPPLPPRQGCISKCTKIVCDNTKDIKGDVITNPSSQEDPTLLFENKELNLSQKAIDTSDYVPMSPRLKDVSLHHLQEQKSPQEGVYMVMR